MSYHFDIGEKSRKVSRFLGAVRRELQSALAQEKASRKLTQQQIATMLDVNRSVINRQFLGAENLTLRRVAELAWALGWEIVFYLRKPEEVTLLDALAGGGTKTNPLIDLSARPQTATNEYDIGVAA